MWSWRHTWELLYKQEIMVSTTLQQTADHSEEEDESNHGLRAKVIFFWEAPMYKSRFEIMLIIVAPKFWAFSDILSSSFIGVNLWNRYQGLLQLYTCWESVLHGVAGFTCPSVFNAGHYGVLIWGGRVAVGYCHVFASWPLLNDSWESQKCGWE